MSEIRDSIGEWDEIGGLSGQPTDAAGWNVRPVAAGREGTISRLKIATFGRPITAERLNNLVPNPLAPKEKP